jgi:hypothetical protein
MRESKATDCCDKVTKVDKLQARALLRRRDFFLRNVRHMLLITCNGKTTVKSLDSMFPA